MPRRRVPDDSVRNESSHRKHGPHEKAGFDSPGEESRRGESRTMLLVLGMLGVPLVGVFLLCAGIVYFSVRSPAPTPQNPQAGWLGLVEKEEPPFPPAIPQEANDPPAKQKPLVGRIPFPDPNREKIERRQREILEQSKAREAKLAERSTAERVAQEFIADAKAKRSTQAYALTTAAYRKQVSAEAFATLMSDKGPTLEKVRGFRRVFVGNQDLDPPYRFLESGVDVGGFVKFEVALVKEGNDWKVDQVFLGKYDPFAK